MALIQFSEKPFGEEPEDEAGEVTPPASIARDGNANSQVDSAEPGNPTDPVAPSAPPEPVCPIYEYIKAHTQDGRLPDGFHIPWIQSMWAPGAQDGVSLYHMAPLQPDPERSQKILQALMMMSDEENMDNAPAIFAIFEELDEKFGIVRLFDEVAQTIAWNQDSLNAINVVNYGDWLLCNGLSMLSIKMGLTIISAFLYTFVEEVMVECGVYDEFTYYAARVLSRSCWENGNDELFELAKNVHGWGRIHAVAYLKPDTQEIEDWLLLEGANNDVHPQYSADTCLEKSRAEGRLGSSLSAEEFAAIGKLIQTALEPGPCPGVTGGDRLLRKFLERGAEFEIDPGLRELIEKELGA